MRLRRPKQWEATLYLVLLAGGNNIVRQLAFLALHRHFPHTTNCYTHECF